MRFSISDVLVKNIDIADDTYKISVNNDTDDLEKSISAVGLINEPVLIQKKSALIIVSGFRRIRALQQLNIKDVTAKVIREGAVTPFDCLKMAIADNAYQRPLTLAEQASAVSKLSSHISSIDKQIELIAEVLNIPPNPSFIKKLLGLSELKEDVRQLIFDDFVSFALVKELGKMADQDLDAFLPYFRNLKLSLNKQRELLSLVTEISKRESITIAKLLGEDDLKGIAIDTDKDKNQKTAHVRSFLKKRRYPHLTAIEDNYHQLVKELKLSDQTTLVPPPYFEGTTFSLKMEFNNFTELLEKNKELETLTAHPIMKKISNKEFY